MSAPTKPEEVLPDEEVQNHSPWWQRFVTGSSTWIGLILVGLILVFSTLEYESFVSSSNARNIATDAAVLLVLAVGMTFVIVTAGIDLSVGAVLVFSGVISARLMNEVGGNDWGTLLVGLAGALGAGLAWGIAQWLSHRQGEDPGADRHARHPRHGARRRAADHRGSG